MGNNSQPPLSSLTVVILYLHLCLQRPGSSIPPWLSVVAKSSLHKENRSFYEGKTSGPLSSIDMSVSPNSHLLPIPSEKRHPSSGNATDHPWYKSLHPWRTWLISVLSLPWISAFFLSSTSISSASEHARVPSVLKLSLPQEDHSLFLFFITELL